MTNEQIVDYVMNSPHNTNKTILTQMLNQNSQNGFVQSDWNQNDPTKADYIKNKPEIGSGGSGGGIFTIFIEENPNGEGYVIDKTYDEMVSARMAGMQLEVRTKETDWDSIYGYDENTIIPYSGRRYSLVAWHPNNCVFAFIGIYHGVDYVYVDSVEVCGEWVDETHSMSRTYVYRETFKIIGEVVDSTLQ